MKSKRGQRGLLPYLIPAVLLTVACSATAASQRPPDLGKGEQRCFDFTVITMTQNPGTTLEGTQMDLLVRRVDGREMLSARTDKDGVAKLHLCWHGSLPPKQIEATVPIAPGQFAGTVVSFNNNSDTYRIFAPTIALSQ